MMSLRDARTHHTATTLQDGNILIAGGGPASSELFVPTKRTWDAPSAMHFNRYDATATLLPDGRVLVTGGTDSLHASANILDSTEIYDPWTNTWEASTHLIQPRTGHATVLLPDGSVLVMGGRQGETQSTPLATVERSGSFVPQSKTHCTPGSVVILENDQCSVGLAFSRINTGSGQLSIHATSSDQALIPDSNLVIEGTGTARQLTIKPARTDARSAPTRQGKAVITVEASDGAQTEKLLYPVSVVPPPWLVMLYLNGDDGPLGGANAGTSPSIAPPIKKLLKSLREMPFNPAMRLVVLSDLHDNYGDSRIYVRDPDGLTDVTPQLLHDQSRWPGFAAELDSADPTTVRALIGWARQTYPDSAFSFLSLLDHGGGWAPEFENSPGQPRAFRIRQAGGWRGMSIDYTNNSDSLSTRETSMALQNLNIDVVFFDACLMAMLESAYEIRNDATYLIAGQNLLFAEFPYDDYFSHEHLTPSTEPKDLALTIARRYNKNVDASANPFTISVIDLSELRVGADAHIPSLVNALAATLLAHLPAGAEPIPASDPLLQAIQQAYVNALKFDYDSSLTLDPNDGYVDLRDFTLHLLSNSALPPDVEAAARQLDAAIRGENKTVLEVNAKTGRYLGHRMDFSRSNGLSIYLPLGEQDYRPTLVDPNNPSCPAKPERQLNYYVDPTQLAFTKDYPQWSRLLMRLENNVSTLRSPLPVGCTTGVAVQQTAALVIDKRPFTSPSQLQLVRQTVFLPAVAR